MAEDLRQVLVVYARGNAAKQLMVGPLSDLEPLSADLLHCQITVTTDGDGIRLTAHGFYKDAAAAQKAESAARGALRKMKDGAAQMAKDKKAEYDSHGEAGRNARLLVDQIVDALEAASVVSQGSELNVSIRYPTDLATVVRTVDAYKDALKIAK